MRYCYHCGCWLTDRGHYCPSCGARLPDFSQLAAPQADPAALRYGQAPNGTDQQPNGTGQPSYGQSQPPYGYNQPPYGQNQAPYGYNQPSYGQNQAPYGYNQPPYGQNQPPYGYNQPPYGQNQPPYGYNQPPYGQNQAPYGYNPAPYRYAPVPVRPPVRQAKPDHPMSRAYRLTTLNTLVTYGTVSQVSSVVLSLAAAILAAIFNVSLGSGSFSVSDLLENGPFVQAILIVYLFAYVGGLLLGLLVSKSIRRRLPAQPPEQRSLSAAAFLRCALAAFGLWGVGVLVGNFPSFIVPLESMDFGWNSVPTWILAVVVAPIFEELIFRKLVLDRVGSFGEAPAVLCSALIFGLAHRNAGQFFLAFLLGILFARIYLRTGKIIYTMLLHFMINFTATFDEVSTLLWGEPFAFWYLIALGVLALAGIVLLIVYRKDPILGRPDRLTAEERGKALRCWPVTLVKWICVYSIIATGLLYCLMGLTEGSLQTDRHLDPLGLLYLIPTALAVVLILVLARRPKQQPVSAGEATGNGQQATGYEENKAEASKETVGSDDAANGMACASEQNSPAPSASAHRADGAERACIAPVIAEGDDAAAEQRQEASGDASLPVSDAADTQITSLF